ncbi:AT-rich interactive domain-containing protein 5B, partial [Halocaridina rubra]
HEVVSLSEKVVLRAEDVIGWMRAAGGVKWDKGLLGVYGPPSQDPNIPSDAHYSPPIAGALDIKEIMREKKLIGDVVEPNSLHIIILGYDKYCRMRALLKRLEGVEEEYMRSRIVVALGGFVVPSRRTWMLFCREVFDYPELEGHDLLCNHLLPEVLTDQVIVPPAAPKLQGRPRKKRKRPAGDSESESSETSEDIRPKPKGKPGLTAKPNGLRVLDKKRDTNRSHLSTNIKTEFHTPALNRLIEVDFMSKLHKFMKDRNTPITRVPHIGYRQLNVFELFRKVQELGGYEAVSDKALWKSLYDEMSGLPPSSNSQQSVQSNSAVMKRHYERLLLPYEKFLLQEQKKIYGIGASRPNKVKCEPGEPSVSILQHHGPSESKPTLKLGGACPPLRPPHVPPGSAQEAHGLPSGPHSGNVGAAAPPVGTPPQASPAPPASVSPPTTPTELTVPKISTKKESGPIPEDLAKRPEITITPIPRTLGPHAFGDPLVAGLPSGPPGLQLTDLMTFEGLRSTLGMSALQDLAKIAEKYDKPLQEPHTKKLKTEESSRINGANSREKGSGRPSVIQETPATKAGLPAVPGLVSADMLRQMNLLDPKLLLPAHQSNKTTISAIAQLFPQTSIFPAPAPAAHQPHHISKSLRDPIRPEPPRVIQSQSVYTQSKHMYGKPTADVNKLTIKDTNKSASPEIEILDLSRPTGNKNGRPHKSERPDIELLDLSTRRDITVSSITKPSTSKNCNSNRIHPPNVSIKSSDHPARQSPNKSLGAANAVSAALAAAAAAQGLPPGLAASLHLNPAALLPYLTPMLSPGGKPNSAAGGSPISVFPFIDPTLAAAYYSMLPHGLIPTTSSSSGGGGGSSGSATVSAAQQMAAAQLHLSTLGLSGLASLNPDAFANWGMYKNLPPGTLPAPHFLSGLMSSQNHNPPTSK